MPYGNSVQGGSRPTTQGYDPGTAPTTPAPALPHHPPEVQVDGADVRHKLLWLEVELAEVLHFQSSHFRPDQVLQEVVEHGDDALSQEGVHKQGPDFWRGHQQFSEPRSHLAQTPRCRLGRTAYPR